MNHHGVACALLPRHFVRTGSDQLQTDKNQFTSTASHVASSHFRRHGVASSRHLHIYSCSATNHQARTRRTPPQQHQKPHSRFCAHVAGDPLALRSFAVAFAETNFVCMNMQCTRAHRNAKTSICHASVHFNNVATGMTMFHCILIG